MPSLFLFSTSVAVRPDERAAISLGCTGTATVETVRVGVEATVTPDATRLLVSLPLVASLSPLW